MKPSLSLLVLITTASATFGVEGFITQHKHSAYTKTRLDPLCAIDPTAIQQLAQIDPSAIQSQIGSVLPNIPPLSQIDISSFLASNTALVNGGIGVGSFLLGSAVTGKQNGEVIEGLEKSVADKESTMQELRTKLEEAQKSDEELNTKITQFEDQIFELENEYENETGEMKKNFQATLQDEKDKTRIKIKKEMQFSMDIKMNKERSAMLQEKMEFVKEVSFEKNAELSKLRFEKADLERKENKAQNSLQQSEEEVEKLMSLKNKKGFWPSEVFGLRMQQAESEKDIDRLTKELEEMEEGLAEANEEIEAFNSKKTFWSFIKQDTKEGTKEKTEVS